MITPLDIENAVSQILKDKTGFKVYKQDIKKTFKVPCFFIGCEFKDFKAANKNCFSIRAEITIVFFPPASIDERTRSEELALKVMGVLPLWFSPNIKVKDRFLTTSGGDFLFTGDDMDILQYTFSATFFDTPDTKKGGDILKIKNIILNSKEEF